MTAQAEPSISKRTARDLMIPLNSYPNIPDTYTLGQAISEIAGAQIERKGKLSLPRILLVFDSEQKLVGLLRRRDIMRGMLPLYLTQRDEPHAHSHFEIEPDFDLHLADLFKDKEHRLLSRNAGEAVTSVMQPIDWSIDADADLIDLIKEMALHEHHFIPVMEDGHVIGVVRTVEMLNQIRRLLQL
jgi:CBS-domain-containing membrane protein